jgi:large subunit ribosomal protein L29
VSKQVEAVMQLRSMTAEELDAHLREQRQKLFEVRFQQAAGQVENHRQIRALRREIGRTMTLQVELAHGHHLASDAMLEAAPAAIEEPEERPRRRRLRRGAAAEVEATSPPEGSEAAAVEGGMMASGAAASEPEVSAETGLDEEPEGDIHPPGTAGDEDEEDQP